MLNMKTLHKFTLKTTLPEVTTYEALPVDDTFNNLIIFGKFELNDKFFIAHLKDRH